MTNSIALNLVAQQATPRWYSQTDSDPAAGGAVFGLSLIMLLIVGPSSTSCLPSSPSPATTRMPPRSSS